MIISFKDKGLRELFESGRTSKIDVRLQKKVLRILDALDRAAKPEEMHIPGFDLHALQGVRPSRYTTHVNGPWCITFEFEGENAARIDFEQYHWKGLCPRRQSYD